MIFLSPRGLRTSNTMKIRLHVRATVKEKYVFSELVVRYAHFIPAITKHRGISKNATSASAYNLLALTTSTTTVVCPLNNTGYQGLSAGCTENRKYSRKSRICIGAPCTFKVPGTVVRVVKSISETSEWVPVSFDIRVDLKMSQHMMDLTTVRILTFPTDGNPTKPTDATPVRATSKPIPPPPPPPPDGDINSRLSFASLALS